MNYSVCLDAVYPADAFFQGMEEVAALGYTKIEFWGWWNKEVDKVADEAKRLGLTVVACCQQMVSLVDDSKRDEYLAGLVESIAVAKRLGCRMLISQVGDADDRPRAEQHASIVAGLKAAASLLEEAGMSMVIEPLNATNHPGYYLTSSVEGAEIVREVASPAVKLLFDLYHQQITEGDLLVHVEQCFDEIGHFHAAGVPGRHELEQSEVNYPFIFAQLDAMGYQGAMGLEYMPAQAPAIGLGKVISD